MKKTKLLLLALSVLLPTLLFAQQRQVKGKIIDETGVGIPDANVSLKGTAVTVKTDGEGNFTLTIPEGTKNVQLTISHVSYPEQTITVSGNEVAVTLQKVAQQM